MKYNPRFTGRNDHLKRLPPEYYRGRAHVHWSMTIHQRKIGWLSPQFYYKFREILTHTAFRYQICCPIFCCMPDHLHLLWVGIASTSDQLLAIRFFRRQLNLVLARVDTRLQSEAYDHVLQEDERERSAFEEVFEYIARNPARAGLVKEDGYRNYAYTGCLVPGYPELRIWQEDFWDRFWRICVYLEEHGLFRTSADE